MSAETRRLPKAPAFGGRMVMAGFGAIGQAVLPLLWRDLQLTAPQLTIIKPREHGLAAAREADVDVLVQALTADNLHTTLAPRLSTGDVLLNLAVDVSSVALIDWCQAHGVLYLDTCIEPWAGGFVAPGRDACARSNHALRQAARARRRRGAPTAVLTHGANPGLVSHFLKQALLNLATDSGEAVAPPTAREGWAALAEHLGVRTIHIAERDTQSSANHKAIGEFVNTWSCEAFVDEATQPAELGWGTHERRMPRDAVRHAGCPQAPGIVLQRPGGSTRVRSWTPTGGPMHGVYTDWTPLIGRGWLFDEDLDRSDPWQFTNFRVE